MSKTYKPESKEWHNSKNRFKTTRTHFKKLLWKTTWKRSECHCLIEQSTRLKQWVQEGCQCWLHSQMSSWMSWFLLNNWMIWRTTSSAPNSSQEHCKKARQHSKATYKWSSQEKWRSLMSGDWARRSKVIQKKISTLGRHWDMLSNWLSRNCLKSMRKICFTLSWAMRTSMTSQKFKSHLFASISACSARLWRMCRTQK